MVAPVTYERKDAAATALLEKLATDSPNPLARLHALCTLDGMNTLTPPTLKALLADKHLSLIHI